MRKENLGKKNWKENLERKTVRILKTKCQTVINNFSEASVRKLYISDNMMTTGNVRRETKVLFRHYHIHTDCDNYF